MNTELIPRQTLAQMADTWTIASEEITEALRLLHNSRDRLQAAFSASCYRFAVDTNIHGKGYDTAPQLLQQMKKDVWAHLINRMELRKLMSLKDQSELDKQIETGEGMPDITLPNLIAMIEGSIARVPQMIEALIKEVYDWLRPYRQSDGDYVTNQNNLWQLGQKVIKQYMVQRSYGKNWYVNYDRQPKLTALDNVFHALDGKGIPRSHYGPLVDAISALAIGQNTGETDYFRFKMFKNGNLHLEIKRTDLLERFNSVSGGMRLGNTAKAA